MKTRLPTQLEISIYHLFKKYTYFIRELITKDYDQIEDINQLDLNDEEYEILDLDDNQTIKIQYDNNNQAVNKTRAIFLCELDGILIKKIDHTLLLTNQYNIPTNYINLIFDIHETLNNYQLTNLNDYQVGYLKMIFKCYDDICYLICRTIHKQQDFLGSQSINGYLMKRDSQYNEKLTILHEHVRFFEGIVDEIKSLPFYQNESHQSSTNELINSFQKIIISLQQIDLGHFALANQEREFAHKIYNTKLQRFQSPIIPDLQDINDPTAYLNLIFNKLLQATLFNTITYNFYFNPFGEITIVFTENKKNTVFNLTQAFQHDPDFKTLTTKNEEAYFLYLCNFYKENIENDKHWIINLQNFPIDEWYDLSSEQLRKKIKVLYADKYFPNLHPVYFLALHIYTTDFYILMNWLLRSDTRLSAEMFTKTYASSNTQHSMNLLQINFFGSEENRVLTPDEINHILRDIVIMTMFTVIGLHTNQSLPSYTPTAPRLDSNGLLNNEREISLRGFGGQWAEDQKVQQSLARLANIQLHQPAIFSATLNPSTALSFTSKESHSYINKVITYNLCGMILDPISRYREQEIVFAPGFKYVAFDETPVKHPEHYNLDPSAKILFSKKITIIITHGISPNLSFYPDEQALISREKSIILYQSLRDQNPDNNNEAINTALELLKNFIMTSRTLFKKIDLLVTQDASLNVSNLKIWREIQQTNHLIILTENGNCYLINNDTITKLNFTLANEQREFEILINLPDHLNKLTNSLNQYQVIKTNIDYNTWYCILKLTNRLDLCHQCRFDKKEIQALYANMFNDLLSLAIAKFSDEHKKIIIDFIKNERLEEWRREKPGVNLFQKGNLHVPPPNLPHFNSKILSNNPHSPQK